MVFHHNNVVVLVLSNTVGITHAFHAVVLTHDKGMDILVLVCLTSVVVLVLCNTVAHNTLQQT